jgi:hypothetical protein
LPRIIRIGEVLHDIAGARQDRGQTPGRGIEAQAGDDAVAGGLLAQLQLGIKADGLASQKRDLPSNFYGPTPETGQLRLEAGWVRQFLRKRDHLFCIRTNHSYQYPKHGLHQTHDQTDKYL